MVRPHLEYGSQVWSVIYKKECVILENVQRRATKLVYSIRNKTYNERLKELGLPSLQYRRARTDMIETYKIINNIDKLDKECLTPKHQTRTRGHSYKIYKRQSRLNTRKNVFSQRIVNNWNSLPDDVICASTVNQFKKQIECSMESKRL